MADIKLNDQGDLEVVKQTAAPIVIPERIIPAGDHLLLEDNFDILQEDGSLLCLENSDCNEAITIPEHLLGDPIQHELVLDRDNLTLRLKRALQTPLGGISMYTLSQGGIDVIDGLYGNNIYRELSEGLTLNFLARVKSHVVDAISRANLTADVDSVEVDVLDPHTVQIFVFYTGRTNPIIIPINI